jgi:hypothetical protein
MIRKRLSMSMRLDRNAVISLWLGTLALVAAFAPSFNLVFSLFMLAMGLAIPTIAYLLWPIPRLEPLVIPAEIGEPAPRELPRRGHAS